MKVVSIRSTYARAALLSTVTALLIACQAEQGASYEGAAVFAEACEGLPQPENAALTLSSASDEWFQVYESAEGVYSIVEPYQFQETISHLIVGNDRAILFDTGIGLLPIRPVVERITDLPVTVLNSHTHYDHVGGNAEFSSVLAIDTDYTRANMQGFENSIVVADLSPEAFCDGPPDGVDLAAFQTKSWTASRFVEDGEILDLGGRQLEILHIPGHTPDSTALLDADNGLLFTGDTFYDAELWLFVPETNLADYSRAIDRLVNIEKNVDYLLGAHVSARVSSGPLEKVQAALSKLQSGEFSSDAPYGDQIVFVVDGIEFVTAQPVLDGKQGDTINGGSGLDTWN